MVITTNGTLITRDIILSDLEPRHKTLEPVFRVVRKSEQTELDILLLLHKLPTPSVITELQFQSKFLSLTLTLRSRRGTNDILEPV